MARNRRKATSLVLILVLVVQAGCTAAEPVASFRPDDPVQMETLREADLVEVVRLDGSRMRLTDVGVADGRLRGLTFVDVDSRGRSDPPEPRSIPLDSIETVQVYGMGAEEADIVTAALSAVLGLLLWGLWNAEWT